MSDNQYRNREFVDLYNKYGKAVYYTSLRLLQDTSLAEDVMQETFIKLQSSLEANEDIRFLGAWLMTVSKNLSLNLLSKRSRENLSEDAEDFAGSYEDKFTNIETFEFIEKTLSVLPEDERNIFTLHVLGGLKHAEISKIMSIPSSTIRWKFMNARRTLKKSLSETDRRETTK